MIDEQKEREEFETEAAQYGFNLDRQELPTVEPWDEYQDCAAGHRWGGWLARAEIAEADRWQPIETAPKDGTRILLCRNELIEPVTVGFWSMVECNWFTPLWANNRHSPICWMPLPNPPAKGERE